jgi:hypothetical protein
LPPSEELEQRRDGSTLKKHRIRRWSLAGGRLSILAVSPVGDPGAGFKAKAVKWKAKIEESVDKLYEYIKE